MYYTMLGVHVTKISKVLDDKKPAKTLLSAIKREVDALGINAVQIFTHGPRNSKENNINYEKVKEYVLKNGIDLSVHSCYSSVSIWKVPYERYKYKNKKLISDFSNSNKDKELDSKYRGYIKLISKQLEATKKVGAWGLVLHVTKHTPETIAGVMNLLKPIAKKLNVQIILEMVSNKSDDNTYETPEKINYVNDLIGISNEWCWCVDTAHLHGAGVDICDKSKIKEWISDIKHKDLIKMFHLNGSSADIGSGKDKHEIAFSPTDKIWYNKDYKKSGVSYIYQFAKKYKCTVICEINRGDEKYTHELLKKLKG